MKWRIVHSGCLPPQDIMAQDANFLEQLKYQPLPLLHLYKWQGPSLTYGHFINPWDHLKAQAVTNYGLQLAKRPTGGGLIFHLTDYAFSVLIPVCHPAFSINTLDNYRLINQSVIQALKRLQPTLAPLNLLQDTRVSTHHPSFCMAQPTIYDVMLKDKKVGGAAQRKTSAGFLHQATISLKLPPISFLQDVLQQSECLISAMQQTTYSFLSADSTQAEMDAFRYQLEIILQEEIVKIH